MLSKVDQQGAENDGVQGHLFPPAAKLYETARGRRAARVILIRIQTAASAETKGYTLVNLGLAYTRNNQTVALAVNNLFDQDYEQIKDFPMEGINYSVSYQIGF